MARKSNKTSHVLNLLAGHDNKEKNNAETENTEAAAAKAEDKPGASPQNISVIDKTEEDELAHLIQEQLEKELESEQTDNRTKTVEETVSEPTEEAVEETEAQAAEITQEVVAETEAQTAEITQEVVAETEAQAAEIIEEAVAETEAQAAEITQEVVAETEAQAAETAEETASASQSETTKIVEESAAESQSEKAEAIEDIVAEAAKKEEPEPDFVVLNVMEHVVKDKIIYFMRQFDVCTCDRCIADTIALTLNGLAPKYIVTTPAAADPLLSFYTNKFISDMTVEATKACMVIKENPRH